MTTGEGGMVVTNDEKIARQMFLYINKAWGYGDANPDHYFMALNYRISELQAAAALGQLEKLEECVDEPPANGGDVDRASCKASTASKRR